METEYTMEETPKAIYFLEHLHENANVICRVSQDVESLRTFNRNTVVTLASLFSLQNLKLHLTSAHCLFFMNLAKELKLEFR